MKIFKFQDLIDSKILSSEHLALAIGVFDGVHRGHSYIFSRLGYAARGTGAKTMVITFDHNPKAFSKGALDTLRLRREYVESFSVDFFVVIDFSDDFSKISGSEFIRLLCTMSRIDTVIVGEDFKCGNPKTRITARDLEGEFARYGQHTVVDICRPVLDDEGIRISSTKLRELILQGNMGRVSMLSGKSYELDLENVPFSIRDGGLLYRPDSIDQLLPPEGNYRSEAVMESGEVLPASLKIGRKAILLSLEEKGHIKTLRIITKE